MQINFFICKDNYFSFFPPENFRKKTLNEFAYLIHFQIFILENRFENLILVD